MFLRASHLLLIFACLNMYCSEKKEYDCSYYKQDNLTAVTSLLDAKGNLLFATDTETDEDINGRSWSCESDSDNYIKRAIKKKVAKNSNVDVGNVSYMDGGYEADIDSEVD